jgi:hypothetical protein
MGFVSVLFASATVGMQSRSQNSRARAGRVDGPSRVVMFTVTILPSGAIGFDGDDGLIAAYRGPQAHVKTRGTIDCER